MRIGSHSDGMDAMVPPVNQSYTPCLPRKLEYGTRGFPLGVRTLRSCLRLLFAFITVSSLGLGPTLAAAAEDSERYDSGWDETNSIHAGATSVQFLTLGGGTNGIYVKRHFSDRGAL